MKKKILLLLNIINTILVTYAISTFFNKVNNIPFNTLGFNCFRYFTIDSNVLSALASLFVVIFTLQNKHPKWLLYFKHIATSAVMVTFLTVIFFLGPKMGYASMFFGGNLYLHLICPLIALVTFFLEDVKGNMERRTWLYGLSTVIVYGLVYGINVIVLKIWPDFYLFNENGFWFVAAIGMLVLTSATSYILYRIRRVFLRKLINK